MKIGKSMRYPIEYFKDGDYVEFYPDIKVDIEPTHTMMVDNDTLPKFLKEMEEHFNYFHFFQTSGNFTIFGLSK